MADIPESTKLLPCPFCGADAQIEHGSDHHGTWFNLGCSRHWGSGLVDADDGCIGGRIYYTESETPEAEAIAAWNTRAAPPAPIAEGVTCVSEPLTEDERKAAINNWIAPPAMVREAVEFVARALWADAQRRLGSVQTDLPRTRTDFREIAVKLMDHPALSTLSADAIRQGEGWQPIETAPRDGTIMDLWVVFPAHDGKPESSLRSADSFWSEKRQDWMTGNGFTLTQYAAKPFATHWMRRPDGPATPASHASDGGKA